MEQHHTYHSADGQTDRSSRAANLNGGPNTITFCQPLWTRALQCRPLLFSLPWCFQAWISAGGGTMLIAGPSTAKVPHGRNWRPTRHLVKQHGRSNDDVSGHSIVMNILWFHGPILLLLVYCYLPRVSRPIGQSTQRISAGWQGVSHWLEWLRPYQSPHSPSPRSFGNSIFDTGHYLQDRPSLSDWENDCYLTTCLKEYLTIRVLRLVCHLSYW